MVTFIYSQDQKLKLTKTLLVTQNKKILSLLNSSHSFFTQSFKQAIRKRWHWTCYLTIWLFLSAAHWPGSHMLLICDLWHLISCCYCLGILFQQIIMKTYPAKNKTHHRSLLPECLQSWLQFNFAGITTRISAYD